MSDPTTTVFPATLDTFARPGPDTNQDDPGFLADALLSLHGSALDAVERPLLGLPWFNPLDPTYAGGAGGPAGDTVKDTAAVVAAARAASDAGGGRVLLVGSKTWLIDAPIFSGLSHVHFVGGGLWKRVPKGSPDGNRFCTVTGCTDFGWHGVRFEVNGVVAFGGVNVNNSSNLVIEDCVVTDSNLQDTWNASDHYWLIIQQSTDVEVRFNIASDVELLEADTSYRVHAHHNTSYRAAGTTALGWFANADGGYAYDYEFDDNTIIDARKNSITLGLDHGLNNTVERFEVCRNRILHLTIAGSGYDVAVGWFGGGAPITGNVFARIKVNDNDFWCEPSLVRTATTIAFMTNQAAVMFDRCEVLRNTLDGGGSSLTEAIEVRNISNSRICENDIHGHYRGIFVSSTPVLNNRVCANRVAATDIAYSLRNLGGGNYVNDNEVIGAPATPWSVGAITATDFVQRQHVADGTSWSS